MRSNFCYIFILSCLGFTSCDSSQVFDEYKTVPDIWNKNESMQFNIVPPDTTNAYNLFVNIRNTNDYKYSNLFLIVEMNYPNGKVQKDTLEYKMAHPDGSFIGTGFTDIKENKLWYKGHETELPPFKFSEEGAYTVKIQHAMRKNGEVNGIENLEGITDIGFRVEKRNSTH